MLVISLKSLQIIQLRGHVWKQKKQYPSAGAIDIPIYIAKQAKVPDYKKWIKLYVIWLQKTSTRNIR